MLRLVLGDCCRLCGAEFVINTHGPHFLAFGERPIPRVARRHLLPGCCDGCWARFNEWRAARMAQERRKSHKIERADIRTARLFNDIAESTYGRFTAAARDEWLATILSGHAKMLSDEAKRLDREREARRFSPYTTKARRRAVARHAPDPIPRHVEWNLD